MRRRLSAGAMVLGAGICVALVALVGSAAATAPVLTMGAATNPTYTTVDVAGTVNPEGESGEWYFQVSNDGGASWVRTNVGGQFGEPAEGTITGLTPGVTYQVRLAAYNYSEFVEVYSSEPNPEFTTESVPSPSVTIDPVSSHTGTTAELSGSITANSPAGNPAVADVHWHFVCSPHCDTSEEGSVAAGQSETVHAEAIGLEANTEYAVTLVGENAGGSATAGPVSFTTSIIAPAAETLPANSLGGGTSAKLRGSVDPNNSPAEYWFEYGPTAAYGQVAPSGGRADAGSGRGHVVSQEIDGLTPGTTYHYRLAVEGPGGPSLGGDMAFTTSPSADQGCPNEAIRRQQYTTRLPECRAYELVSPANKEGGAVGGAGNREYNQSFGLRISTDGNAAIFTTSTALAGSSSANFIYKASRLGGGWSSAQVALPSRAGQFTPTVPLAFASSDLSTGLFVEEAAWSAEELFTGTESVFLHGLEPGGFTTRLNPGQTPGRAAAVARGQSKDLSHALFTSNTALTADAPSGAFSNLYDYSAGSLHLVSILTDGQADPVGAQLGTNVTTHGADPARFNAVSDDGSHIAFTALSDGQVYQRIDDTRTVEVSASQGGADPTGAFPAQFVAATTDGSKVFFISAAELTPDANTGGHSGKDLYEYDVATGRLVDLTVDENPGDPAGADVLGLAGLANDGSTLFVVAEGVLAPGAAAGKPNLYALHPGGSTEFVGTLIYGVEGTADSPLWEGGFGQGGGGRANPSAQAAPNGRFLAFATRTPLTPDAVGGLNVYLYDADASGRQLTCVSCGPGDAEDGEAHVSSNEEHNLKTYQPRFVFDNGSVVFMTAAALLPQDTNGRFDVYQYHQGALDLLSSGRGDADAEFSDASPDGSDILILTGNRLLAADQDEAADLYDVRVDGGFPEPPPPTPCAGEGCRPPATASPASTTPASSATGDVHGTSKGRPFRLAKVSAKSIRNFAKTGRLILHVKTGGAGVIMSKATARLGKRKRLVARDRRSVAGAREVSLVLRLSTAARKQLAESGRMKVAIKVTFTEATRPSVLSLTLIAPKHDRKGR